MRVAWRRYFNSHSDNLATSCELEVKMTLFRFRDSACRAPTPLPIRFSQAGAASRPGHQASAALTAQHPAPNAAVGPARGASERQRVRRAAVRSRMAPPNDRMINGLREARVAAGWIHVRQGPLRAESTDRPHRRARRPAKKPSRRPVASLLQIRLSRC